MLGRQLRIWRGAPNDNPLELTRKGSQCKIVRHIALVGKRHQRGFIRTIDPEVVAIDHVDGICLPLKKSVSKFAGRRRGKAAKRSVLLAESDRLALGQAVRIYVDG